MNSVIDCLYSLAKTNPNASEISSRAKTVGNLANDLPQPLRLSYSQLLGRTNSISQIGTSSPTLQKRRLRNYRTLTKQEQLHASDIPVTKNYEPQKNDNSPRKNRLGLHRTLDNKGSFNRRTTFKRLSSFPAPKKVNHLGNKESEDEFTPVRPNTSDPLVHLPKSKDDTPPSLISTEISPNISVEISSPPNDNISDTDDDWDTNVSCEVSLFISFNENVRTRNGLERKLVKRAQNCQKSRLFALSYDWAIL